MMIVVILNTAVKTLLRDICKEHPRLIALESDTERINKLIQVNPLSDEIHLGSLEKWE